MVTDFFGSVKRVALVSVLAAVTACSAGAPANRDAWLSEGSILVARRMPSVSTEMPASLLAFIPSRTSYTGNWLSIDRTKGTIALMNGDKQLAVTSGEGAAQLRPSVYHLALKQRDALWYAPDSYFSSRQLSVPDEGSKDRYLRGALGNIVLYLDAQTPLHSSPIWSSEVGGMQVAESELAEIYSQLEIGAPIEVR